MSANALPDGGAPLSTDPEDVRFFAAIPEGVETPVLDETTKLGKMLFADARLSAGRDVSCASCHPVADGAAGADGVAFSPGSRARKRARNTPTVLNAGGSFAQGWDARSSTMEEFVVPHALEASTLGLESEKRLLELVGSVPAYAAAFKKAFPDESPSLSGETFGRAVGGFTKKLFARGRWDAYLSGTNSALTKEELLGLRAFVEAGCATCHQGKYVGATQTQKLGIAQPWPGPAGGDVGRFEISHQEPDRGMWKVPSLRNVARTAPYLHDGSVATLAEVTRLMARHQVGRELPEDRVAAIVTFLGALDGVAPKVLTDRPNLPAGGPKGAKVD